MNFNEYSKKAIETAIYPLDSEIIYPTLGLNGEAGEVAEKIKKVIRDKQGNFSNDDRIEIAKELGDCLWYINAIAKDIGVPLDQIARLNIEKLQSRKKRKQLKGEGDNR